MHSDPDAELPALGVEGMPNTSAMDNALGGEIGGDADNAALTNEQLTDAIIGQALDDLTVQGGPVAQSTDFVEAELPDELSDLASFDDEGNDDSAGGDA